MRVLVIILSIIIFIRTISYGLFEFKDNNKSGGIAVIIIGVTALILPNLVVYIRGI
ncbi:MAG: hypothetical protein IJB90_05710 [Clostridia bacterium]|nr:hypothetical protein [Clostridia bacterium]